MTYTQIWLFTIGALILIATPGPNIFFLIARTINQGKTSAFKSAIGIELATLTHIAFATVGLSAILLSSAAAFNFIKYLGAGYLIYLGCQKLFIEKEVNLSSAENSPATSDIWQGYIVNLLNPKTAIFFFAFFPQFINADADHSLLFQVVILSSIFFSLALIVDLIYVGAASFIRPLFDRNPSMHVYQRYITGSAYIGLGLAAAVYTPARK